MKIYRPIKSNHQTQKFGEAKACAKANQYGGAAIPVKITNKIAGTCLPGYVDFYTAVLGMKGHNGEDWGTVFKEACHFPVDADTGWYAKTEVDKDGGIGIDVYSKKRIFIDELPTQAGPEAKKEWKKHNKMMYVKFRFWHHHSVLKIEKAAVAFGEKIALCDSTGASGGNHLHWSMKFVDENDVTLDRDNGYTGAVDFSRWYENTYILDELKEREIAKTAIEVSTTVITDLPNTPPEEQKTRLNWIAALIEAVSKFFR